MSINLKRFKLTFIEKFPNSALSTVLLMEPDDMTEEEFLAKARTWLFILETKKG